jgi:biopolymer transport protein TolR
MAASLNGGGSRRGKGRFARGRYTPMAEINVTPFVDVMLVLLIIFMVAAPLLNVGVPVDLPKTEAKPITGQDEPLVVSVDAKGEIFLQETKIGQDELLPRLRAISANKPDQRIFVRGDKAISYGRVMEVMGMINGAGFTKVALVAEQPATPARPGTPATPAPAGGQRR